MADHFYSIPAGGEAISRTPGNIVVATAAQSGNPIELRVTDGAMTGQQVYQFVEWLADLFATRNVQVIVPGTVLD